MTTKIGINGFGRIGRMVFRAAVQNFNDVEIVGINDLLEPDYLAYMLQYDSVHGRFQGAVSVKDGALVVNGKTIRLTQERDPANLNWGAVGADVGVAGGGDGDGDGGEGECGGTWSLGGEGRGATGFEEGV
jgi:glyceraldehyde 3-phosphate dehydrogenase